MAHGKGRVVAHPRDARLASSSVLCREGRSVARASAAVESPPRHRSAPAQRQIPRKQNPACHGPAMASEPTFSRTLRKRCGARLGHSVVPNGLRCVDVQTTRLGRRSQPKKAVRHVGRRNRPYDRAQGRLPKHLTGTLFPQDLPVPRWGGFRIRPRGSALPCVERRRPGRRRRGRAGFPPFGGLTGREKAPRLFLPRPPFRASPTAESGSCGGTAFRHRSFLSFRPSAPAACSRAAPWVVSRYG